MAKTKKVCSLEQHVQDKFNSHRRDVAAAITTLAHDNGLVLVGVLGSPDPADQQITILAHSLDLEQQRGEDYARSLITWLGWSIETMNSTIKILKRGLRKHKQLRAKRV